MSRMPEPCADNDYLADHVQMLRSSLRALTGRDLVDGDPSPAEAARLVYRAPFAVLSHGTEADPLLNYANRCALDLFELDWETMVGMPSRLTAEAPEREERFRLLARVAAQGYIDDYSGVRVSRTGRRFVIEAATVWNLEDVSGQCGGQAAVFALWRPI